MTIARGSRRAVLTVVYLAQLPLVGVLSCESATKPAAYTIAAVSGDGAAAEVGSIVSPDPAVLVLADGKPAGGIQVQWSAEDGSSTAASSTLSNAQGRASVAWTLGTKAGAQHLGAAIPGGAAVRLTATATSGAIASLTLKPDAIVLADIGDSVALGATALDRFGNELQGVAPAWHSLEPTVATVSSLGVVRGASAGAARIVGSSGSATDTALVEVRQPAGSIVVSPHSAAFSALGATTSLSAVVRDRRGAQLPAKTVQWSSRDTAVAAVDAGGVIRARRNGKAWVLASADDVRDSALAAVQQLPARLRVDSPSASVAAGDSVRLGASVLDSLGSALADAPVVWTSADTALAGVGAGGWVRGLRSGVVDVVARAGTLTGVVRVTVLPGRPVAVRITPDSASVYVGSALALSASVADAMGNPLPVSILSWSSSDTSRATVDPRGVVTGLDPGPVVIRARADTASGAARIVVLQRPPASAVRITTRSVQLNYIGARAKLEAQVLDATGHALQQLVPSWRALDPSLATITADGRVSQVAGSGSARMEASYGGHADTAQVLLRQMPHSVRMQPAVLSLSLADTMTITATLVDSGGVASPVGSWEPGILGVSLIEVQLLSSFPASAVRLKVRAVLPGSVPLAITLVSAAGLGEATACYDVNVKPEVVTVRIEPRSATLNYVGATTQLTARLTGADGRSLQGLQVFWESRSSAATVSQTGVVTEVAPSAAGAAIVAHWIGSSDTVLVALRQVPKAAIASPSSVSLQVGDSVWVSGKVVDSAGVAMGNSMMSALANGTGYTLKVIVTGDPGTSGVWVRGASPGSGRVDLLYEPGITASVPITVVGRSMLLLAPHSATLNYIGATLDLAASAIYLGAVVPASSIAWRSLDPGVMTVNAAAHATAVSTGTARLVASYMTVADTAVVTVRQVARMITVAPTSVTVSQGDSVPVSFTVVDSAGAAISRLPFASIAFYSDGGQFSYRIESGRVWVRGVVPGSGTLSLGLDAASASISIRIQPRAGGSLSPVKAAGPPGPGP